MTTSLNLRMPAPRHRGGVHRLARLWVIPLMLAAGSASASAQAAPPLDTTISHFARAEELPAMLEVIASVVDAGFDETTREMILADVRSIRPEKPVARPTAHKQWAVPVRFRGQESLLRLSFYWADTSRVGVRPNTADAALSRALSSALYAALVRQLVPPNRVFLGISDIESEGGRRSFVYVALREDSTTHCPQFGLEYFGERRSDTLVLHLAGVPAPGRCPLPRSYGRYAGLPDSTGRYVIAVEAARDTNRFILDVTDSLLTITPTRQTFVAITSPLRQWRVPASSSRLRCDGGADLCHELHEWIAALPGVQRVPRRSNAPANAYPGPLYEAIYRSPDSATLARVRACVGSIDSKIRRAGLFMLSTKTADGRWWVDYATETARRTAEPALDIAGKGPPACKLSESSAVVQVRAAAAPADGSPPRWPRTTAVAMFAYGKTDATTIEATSDGWVVIAPLTDSPWGPKRDPFPTTRLYARAADALRWAERVTRALRAMSDPSADGAQLARTAALGSERVSVIASLNRRDTGEQGVSFQFADCEGLHRNYNVDRNALLEIATNVKRAAEVARAASPTAVAPTLARPYYASEVSCTAVPDAKNVRPRMPDDLPAAERRTSEIGVRFVVDTLGRTEPGSIAILPRTSPQLERAIQTTLAQWRYRPAEWAGAPVRQVINTTVTFEPFQLRQVARDTGETPTTPVRATAEDGWVHLRQGRWQPDGRFAGNDQWVLPDSADAWLARARAFLAAETARRGRARDSIAPPRPEWLGYPNDTKLRLSYQNAGPHLGGNLRVDLTLVGCRNEETGYEPADSTVLARIAEASRETHRTVPALIDGRAYTASEVSCRAGAAYVPLRRRDAFPGTWRYPLRITAPASALPSQVRADVLTSVVIDSTGVPERETIEIVPGTDPDVARVLRATIGDVRFVPAQRAGRRVRQRVTKVWLVEPAPICVGPDAGPECAPASPASLAFSDTLPVRRKPVPPSLLQPQSLYDVRSEVAPIDESEALAAPLGLPSLKHAVLPKGTREIRIYSGLVIGYPHSGLIVREERGSHGRVTGRLFRYWPRNDAEFTKDIDLESRYAALEAGRCGQPKVGPRAVVCVVRFAHEPDWRALLRELDRVQAWDLPDESTVPHRGWIIDGWRLRAEARRDTTYKAYEYHNPQIYRPPEGPNALRLMAIVDSLFRYAAPPVQLQHLRGLYFYGPDTSDFVPCGHPSAIGLFEGHLDPVKAFLGDSAWKARAAPAKVLEIEGWMRGPRAGVQRGRRWYETSWQADSITMVRASATRTCSP